MACVDAGCKRLFAARRVAVCREVGRERLGLYRGFAHAVPPRPPPTRLFSAWQRCSARALGRAARDYTPDRRAGRRHARGAGAGVRPGLAMGLGGGGAEGPKVRAGRWGEHLAPTHTTAGPADDTREGRAWTLAARPDLRAGAADGTDGGGVGARSTDPTVRAGRGPTSPTGPPQAHS